MEKRKHPPRQNTHHPVLCYVYNHADEIIITPARKLGRIRVSGMQVNAPIRLMLVKSRMIETVFPVPNSPAGLEQGSCLPWESEGESEEEAESLAELTEADPVAPDYFEQILSNVSAQHRGTRLNPHIN